MPFPSRFAFLFLCAIAAPLSAATFTVDLDQDVLDAGGEIFLTNSVIESGMSDCNITGSNVAFTAQIDNVIDVDGTCSALAVNGWTADPLLKPLSRPAGQVSYLHRPVLDTAIQSPVLDRAENDSCTGWLDQSGRARPVDLPGVENAFGERLGRPDGAAEMAFGAVNPTHH